LKHAEDDTVRALILAILCCLLPIAVQAGDNAVADPAVVAPAAAVLATGSPIDVRGLGLTRTAQLGVLHFDIADSADIGTMTFNGSCSHPYKLTLGGYDVVTKDMVNKVPLWGLDLPSIQRIFAVRMEQRGYPKYEPDLSLFQVRLGSDADLRVAVTFTEMKFAKCSDARSRVTQGSNAMKAKWDVYSQRDQKIVYSKIAGGNLTLGSSEAIEDRDFNRRIIEQMIDSLQADPEFVAIFKSPAPAVTP